jgi:hypothetical protein
MPDRPISRSRRHFLLAVGAGGAGAAVAARLGSPAQAAGGAPSRKRRDGYRLTPHIGNYYRTAKF